MYIVRKKTINKVTKKEYYYYKLVDAVQTEKGARQRVILHLGQLDLNKIQINSLAKVLEMRISGKKEGMQIPIISELADKYMNKYNDSVEKIKEKQEDFRNAEFVSVDIKSIRTQNSRSIGPEIICTSFWKKIKIDNILKSLNFSDKEINLAKAIIIGRLISPGSEIQTYNWFKKMSSLNELMDFDLSEAGKDAFYEIGDLLYSHKHQIEKALRSNLSKEYSLKDTIYLYDLTNTYFESPKTDSLIAKHGKSKELRHDCPLVTLALVVDQNGFPVYSEIFRGNQSEPETLPMMISKIIDKSTNPMFIPPKYCFIMDRGIATEENLRYLKENKYSYFVVERRNAVKDYKDEFTSKQGFTEYITSNRDNVLLKKIEKEDKTQLLVISSGKEQKEKSIIGKKEERFLEDANNLIKSNQKKTIVLADKINIRIGRLKERYGAIANCYEFVLINEKNNNRVASIELKSIKDKPLKQEFGGCYIIETDDKQMSDKEIWDAYMSLNKVEKAFQSMKSQLGTRPIYHQKDSRIESHLFISVLSYSILKSIEYEMEQKNKNTTWESMRKTLSTHQRSTVILRSEDSHIYYVRTNGDPEEEHKEIYNTLNIKLSYDRRFFKTKISL